MKYDTRYATNPEDFKNYDTEKIRDHFLIETLFVKDDIRLTYSHYDRYIAGGAMPVNDKLSLDTIDPLKSSYFLERREMGIINIGGTGIIDVDGKRYTINTKEALYIGKGVKEVDFSSVSSDQPAKFYINSAPAHHSYKTKLITRSDAEIVDMGAPATSNARTITKLIVNSVLDTCQLQMGMTELKSGSVWNTMPAHIHDRRMEVYLYLDVPKDQAVCHFMGQKTQTRGIWMHNEQAIISPPWSMHCGAGTSSYTFIWGMCGENLDYSDMDGFAPTEMR